MTENGTSSPVDYYEDELVVARADLVEVCQWLGDQGILTTESKEDNTLELALLSLANTDSAAEKIKADPERRRSILKLVGVPATNFDWVVSGLRAEFRRAYNGHVPTVGKNRVLGNVVTGAPYTSPGPPHLAGGYDVAALDTFEFRPDETNGAAGRGVRIGILDTRLFAHPLLEGSYVAAKDALLNGASADQVQWWQGHATFIAGLLRDRARTSLLEVRSVLTQPEGTAAAWDVAVQMAQFARSGVDILNLSFTCMTDDDVAPLLFTRAIELLTPTVVVVAAAGNHGAANGAGQENSRKSWPAALPDVIAVGAHNGHYKRAPFSAAGPWVTVYAPGVGVRSTYLKGPVDVPEEPTAAGQIHFSEETFHGQATWSGTSFASAIVSGEVAARTRPGQTTAGDAARNLLNGAPRYGDLDTPHID